MELIPIFPNKEENEYLLYSCINEYLKCCSQQKKADDIMKSVLTLGTTKARYSLSNSLNSYLPRKTVLGRSGVTKNN